MMGEYKMPNDRITNMSTVYNCMDKARHRGYVSDFSVMDGKLYDPLAGKSYQPDNIGVADYYRFEGDSDPGDETILYLIETNDGRKGILFDAYGVYGDDNIGVFMVSVNSMHKKTSFW